MQFTYSMALSSMILLGLTNPVFADSQAHQAEKQANITKTLETYKACDMKELIAELQAVQLQNKAVFKVSDQITEGDSYYYEVKDTRSGIYDATFIKSNVCNYIMKNSCYVYWNNVMATGKIAPIALKTVLVSPPDNLLSPLLGCKTSS
ncbi:hypothetical protein [Legionella oakridgensis]|uniref:Uncharacterized protein n=2 Tax=Legionella oakridgensis TaxID=29423 RepID=W0BCE9_9GAMM|nr:hypothetical protein [Legionella oakridgensis]AHE67540.1 hypothetical protein Loa_01996 [Legionella oakridgensis ATCC 33761 = DSM 21215]ETO92788.1 hypothetical protein LOR_61c14420 [Legionella oakridgensis RV-2-2007]KTD37105.1 hypothetical protein Loak_2241 [Legionella oakridgensis]STY20585.1 Uncharacterised protein [Legionella longbeachae]